MTETIVLDLSLQKRLVANAHQNNLSIDELLNDALDYYLRLQDEKKLKEEIVAYEAMHDELWKTHPMEWVAFHEQQMVDHDPDKLTLHRRIRTNYPDIAVLMRQVKEFPIEGIWICTPSTGKLVQRTVNYDKLKTCHKVSQNEDKSVHGGTKWDGKSINIM